jgi:hypothetical protein
LWERPEGVELHAAAAVDRDHIHGGKAMAERKWIKGAIKHKGALHKALGVPEGEKIPKSKLQAAEKKGGKVGREARLAENLSHLSHKHS